MPVVAEVILPLPVRSNFHYRIKEHQLGQLQIGQRVLVSFGKSKIYTAIIRDLPEISEPEAKKLKPIEEILDETPILSPIHLKLFAWISFYYMCTEGEVFKAALPMGLKPESALRVEMVENLAWEDLPLDDKEYVLMEALSIQPVLNFKEIAAIWEMVNPNPRLKTMAARGYIRLFQQVEESYQPKMKAFLKLSPAMEVEENLNAAFESLKRANSQENLLMRLTQAFFQGKPLPKTETLKELNITSQVAKALIKKGFVVEEKVQVDRLALYGYKQHNKEIILNPEQEEALKQIRAFMAEKKRKPVLLHGITGSGKTHIYIELIKEALAQKKQVLYLLPEITLTKQIIDRVKSEFGEQVGIYHSRFNDQERVEILHKVRAGAYQVVIGVRSAVFLPFQQLGLIVVDEEHDHSFKQYEPAPRYQARDLAVYYSQVANCPVVLGSATPAFETYANALKNKFHLVELTKRATDAQLPEIEIVDMRVQRKKRLVNGVFSTPLQEAIQQTLERKEQVILFQNRRGYSPFLICDSCGHVPQCVNCDISMTYHKERNQLRCHYCGHTEFQVQKCANCSNFTMRRSGIGTERIEEQVAELLPDHVVQRMDLDTTRSKMGFQHIISRFENKQIDILVGTQMVSKGLDFENVTLVGVVNADNLLSFPDFRAYENAYNLLTQVSGRAGRSHKKGRVIIQTMMPDNVVLKHLQKPYADFFRLEASNRKPLGYPPFTRLVRIEFRHKDHNFIEQESLRLHKMLKPLFGPNLLGPDYALVGRVRNQYRMQFLIKLSKQLNPQSVRTALQKAIEEYYTEAPLKTLRIIINVDPA
ncbi:MAG: primosomal protein N' [Bacteroidota bacterium]